MHKFHVTGNKDIDKGKKQWELLDLLIKKYETEDISDVTSSEFSAQKWETPNDRDTKSILFGKYCPEETHLPFQVFMKILMVHMVRERAFYSSSISNGINALIRQWVPIFNSLAQPILVAKRGERWVNFSSLQPFDIAYCAEHLISKNAALNKSGLFTLNSIALYQKESDISLFSEGFITPWIAENISVIDWHDQLRKLNNALPEKKPYSAFTDETVAKIVSAAMPFLGEVPPIPKFGIKLTTEEKNEPIISILQTIKNLNEQFICAASTRPVSISNSKSFKNILKKHKLIIDKLHPYNPQYLKESIENHKQNTIQPAWFTTLFNLSQQAAIWILALTTGLRNSDLRYLNRDCLHYSDIFEIWYVKAKLIKTKNTIFIPIGEPTVKAIKMLNWLQISDKCDYLISKVIFSFSGTEQLEKNFLISKLDTLNRKLKNFADYCETSLETISDDDKKGTCHNIRATLAGYIGKHSTLAILILKKLFGHSNNLMPDQYLRHNIFVRQEREQQLERMHSNIAHQIAQSIVKKEIGGIKGKELLKGAAQLEKKITEEMEKEYKLENKSLSEGDVHKKLIEVLQEIILNDTKNEQTQTLLTPMGVVCMRATNQSTDSPCAATINKKERDKAGVSRAMFSAITQLPNPAQCIGIDCQDAAVTKIHSLPLLAQFDWYSNILRHGTDENREINEDAKHFVETYYPIIQANNLMEKAVAFMTKHRAVLKYLYEDQKRKGYFDD